DLHDIAESIQLQQRAVKLTPEGHADLPSWLNNLGNSFLRRFAQTGNLSDIAESIQLRQRAAELTPEGHSDLPTVLNNLGNSFTSRFGETAEPTDISEAIQIHQQAIKLTPDCHSHLPERQHSLGNSLLLRYKSAQNVTDALLAHFSYRASALSMTGPPSLCLESARRWASLVPETFPSETLTAHARVIELISIIAGMENTSKRRHELLKGLSYDSTRAAAAALSVNQPSKALEWLEAGRCVVWNQTNQLRTPLDDLKAQHPRLADRFRLLSEQLEHLGSRADPRQPGVKMPMQVNMSLEAEAHHHFKLAKEREQLLATIREMPGFENFLRPKSFAELMRGIPEEGATVVINSDESRCDALILFAGIVEPIVVRLENFTYEKATSLAEALRVRLQTRGLQSRYPDEARENTRGMRSADENNFLQAILHDLWTDLVEPILKQLPAKFQNKDGTADLPHIRWCPTGPFVFLPIHAAGIYPKTGKGISLAEFAVSSYIPNLTILERLGSRGRASTSNPGVLLISQPDTPGLQALPSTDKEIERTSDELTRRGIRTAAYTSKRATTTAVLNELEFFSCIHFACHASQNTKDPLESAVRLYDGPLKLSEIMKKNLPNAELAFMSACQTSVGDESLPEEVVHLAAGMLTAGYRSVIATMWSISDAHAPDVAEDFYKCLLNDETADGVVGLDITGSAQALHIAVQALRRKLGDSTEALLKWIPYVHFGI
ncbi:hypothetical protein CVT26_005815, partial [Gymnopilus dilepis]